MRASLSAVLVGVLASSPPTLAHAGITLAAGPMDVFYDKLGQAEQAEGAGELSRAADLYAEAYDALPRAEKASETGSDVVRAASRVRSDQFLQNPKDPAPLAPHRALLERHIADIQSLQPDRSPAEFEKVLASVSALQEGFEAPEATKTAENEPPPEETAALPPPDPDPEPEKDILPEDRRPLGLGLTIGGGIALVGGVVLVAVGGNLFSSTTRTYLGNSDSAPADCTIEGSICDLNEWRDGEYTRANALLAVGSILAAAGIGLVIGGTVVLVRDRNARASVGVTPMYTRRGAGLSLSGRF
jgi:hypothetical protein